MTEREWTKSASDVFVGRKIKKVEYLTKAEAEKNGWYKRPLALMLDNGHWICSMQDDEGNDGGAYFTSSESIQTIPTLSLDHDKRARAAKAYLEEQNARLDKNHEELYGKK